MRRFVVVEGLIGAGKTTLCRLIAREWNASLVLEPAETNPFLEPFYRDRARYGFPVQMFYLINRWRQQDVVRQPGLFEDLVVSDYLFAKDRMFAEKVLAPLELELYDRFARALGESAPRPDLVVYLDVPTDVLLQRIARRSVPGEDAIDAAYLDDLRERYERLWGAWDVCPVLRLDNRGMNYADDPAGRDAALGFLGDALYGDASPGVRGGAGAPGTPGSATADREAQPKLFGTGA